MNPVRRVRFKHIYNFRDLGGYQAEAERITAWNRLYRCDCPNNLDADEWQIFRDLGIKTLIDLRSTYEVSENPVHNPDDFRYVDCHFFHEEESVDLTGEAGKSFLQSLSIDYRVMAQNAQHRIALIFQAILESLKEGNIVFFCTAGKDRTGIIAAEILRICGVSDEDIIADYAVTEIYNEKYIQARLAALPREILNQLSPETMARATASKPETMRAYLAWSKESGFPSMLHSHGFTYEMQARLKELLLR
ncbi:MAG: tyrosine-protein phosphatase [Blautia sp.]|nr:tyrosine-protein phosphatase [Blautia sp.]